MQIPKRILAAGNPDNLGAIHDGHGVNFAIFSAHATKVELCLFDEAGKVERERIVLPQKTGDIWHGYVPGLKPGQVYGYRVHGPYEPENGHRFNPDKLVLDPYARELVGEIRQTAAHTEFDHDNAADMVKSRVTAALPPPARKSATPWNSTVLYELHVRGFTMSDPSVPQEMRGTCAALGSKPVLDYLEKLGITVVELLPVQAKVNEARLENAGLKNYWGYNTLGFFAVEPGYLASGKREEFQKMVAALHKAGIEVILDVVFNHSGEGDDAGPTLSFRGIDNASYYKLDPADKSKYVDETGCGNTLNLEHPQVRRMVLDSLRYWVDEFGVDGFRFDLAPVLGRTSQGFSAAAPFFKDITADPVLSQVKLIAEPWDCGAGGYQLGNFPPCWHEWNDKFRDDIRRFWRGDAAMVGNLATRLAGSSPQFNKPGRTPLESVNMVTCHDGFTLQDLVSYTEKKNQANGEGNKDGHGANFSGNCGVEGETDDPAVMSLRARRKRNMLATLFLAQGVPMLLSGDESGNTQHGNNNAYCQDNETGWTDRRMPDSEETRFVQKLSALRRENPVLQQDVFPHERDVRWLSSAGTENKEADWKSPDNKCLGMLLSDHGQGKKLLAIFNAAAKPASFALPDLPEGEVWQCALDTSRPVFQPDEKDQAGCYIVPESSVIVFTQKRKQNAKADR